MIENNPAFCDCEFPSAVFLNTTKCSIPELCQCRCGEEDSSYKQWLWHDDDETDAQLCGPDVTFHPTFSQGTSIVRGQKPLKAGEVHFWELRILTELCGTDMMIGVGTDKVDINEFKFHFTAALGSNSQSWGFSYNGRIQHNGEQTTYGQRLAQGCVVGVYVDRSQGYIEFFLNRRSMGIAYHNIPTDPNVLLYPMICSTAAKSAMRLMNCTSEQDCLQYRSYRALVKNAQQFAELLRMPGFRMLQRSYWFLAPPIHYVRRSANVHENLDMADEAVISKNRKNRKKKYTVDEFEQFDLDFDIYANAHKIPYCPDYNSDEEDDFYLLL